MYRERSEQSEPTPARDPEPTPTMKHLKMRIAAFKKELRDKGELDIWFLVVAALISGAVHIAFCASVASGSHLATCIVLGAACPVTIGLVAHFTTGFIRRAKLIRELAMRELDLEHCAAEHQEHHVRRATETCRAAGRHLGIEDR